MALVAVKAAEPFGIPGQVASVGTAVTVGLISVTVITAEAIHPLESTVYVYVPGFIVTGLYGIVTAVPAGFVQVPFTDAPGPKSGNKFDGAP
ncbi:hypothetical protein D3C80_1007430 [compost metagenome]